MTQSRQIRRYRILVRPEPERVVPYSSATAAVLGALVRKIGEHEPDLMDLVHAFASHKIDNVGRVGGFAFHEYRGGMLAWYSSTQIIWDFEFSCIELTEVTLPNSLTHIGGRVFEGCTGLTLVTLPDSLTHIGKAAFFGCKGLRNVALPNSLTYIGRQAFCDCT